MPVHQISIKHLSASHRGRLRWFESHAGQTVPFPNKTADGLLVTRAKGIYKPADLRHALSIRVMLSSPYADKAVREQTDGTWSLEYFQENPDPAELMSEYTNRGLLECCNDRVPVGVLVQTSTKPVRYDVLGLAIVTGWSDGLFSLESAIVVERT